MTAAPAVGEYAGLVERLNRGATKSTGYSNHLIKYQALCDEAATAITTILARLAEQKQNRATREWASWKSLANSSRERAEKAEAATMLADVAREVATERAYSESVCKRFDDLGDVLDKAEASLRSANSRIERLEKALRPLAEDAVSFPPQMRDDQVVAVQLGLLRRASEAHAEAAPST